MEQLLSEDLSCLDVFLVFSTPTLSLSCRGTKDAVEDTSEARGSHATASAESPLGTLSLGVPYPHLVWATKYS